MGGQFTYAMLPLAKLNEADVTNLRKVVMGLRDKGDLDGADTYATVEEARDKVLAALKEYVTMGDWKMVSHLQFEALPFDYMITGGESWGDNPNDAYTTMETIYNCGPLYRGIEEIACRQAGRSRPLPGRLTAALTLLTSCTERLLDVVEPFSTGANGCLEAAKDARDGLSAVKTMMSPPAAERER